MLRFKESQLPRQGGNQEKSERLLLVWGNHNRSQREEDLTVPLKNTEDVKHILSIIKEIQDPPKNINITQQELLCEN